MLPSKKTSWDDANNPETTYSMPSRFFFDPQILEEEKHGIFYKAWHVVGHVNEFKEPGSYLTQEIFDQSVVVISGRDGEIRAFHNVCQHRGNRLLEGRRGKLPAVIRCPYHSWAYGFDGALRAAPHSDCLGDFDKASHGLKPVRLEIYAGFVYINMDADAETVAALGAGEDGAQSMAEEMRHFMPDLDGLKLVEEVDVIVPANWKVIQENSIEGYHFDLSGPVHKHLAALIDYKSYRLTPHGKWWTYKAPPAPGLDRETGKAYGVALKGATWQTDWFFNIGLFPNTTFYSFPFTDMVGTFVMIPLEAEKSLLRFGYYAPQDRATPALTQAAITWMNQELGPEDIQLNISNQKGLHSFGYDQGRYLVDAGRSHQSEHLVRHFHQLCYSAIGPQSATPQPSQKAAE